MPELPDLTLYAKNLRKRVLGRPIVSADIFNRAKVNATPGAFRQAAVGQTIDAIDREGKELHFILSNGEVFGVHLMLAGRFALMPMDELHSVFKKIICLGFEDGEALVVTDSLGMARVTLGPPKSDAPDALSPDFSPAYFKKIAKRKGTMNVKAFLIDQKIVRGIGNAYVDEMLYRAGISPKSIVGKLPPDALDALYEAIEWVLTDAIAQLEDICPDSISGEERSFLRVHHPKKKETADGEPIVCEEIAGKRTYFTPGQKLYI